MIDKKNKGRLLKKRYMQAEAEEKIQVDSHEGWTARLPQELVEEWEGPILAWEKAPFPKKDTKDLLNPFAIPNECKYSCTLQKQEVLICYQVLTEEQAFAELQAEDAVRTGADHTLKSSFPSAPTFIATGISLGEEQ